MDGAADGAHAPAGPKGQSPGPRWLSTPTQSPEGQLSELGQATVGAEMKAREAKGIQNLHDWELVILSLRYVVAASCMGQPFFFLVPSSQMATDTAGLVQQTSASDCPLGDDGLPVSGSESPERARLWEPLTPVPQCLGPQRWGTPSFPKHNGGRGGAMGPSPL